MASEVRRDSKQREIIPGDMLKFDKDEEFFTYAIYIGSDMVVHRTKDEGVVRENLLDVSGRCPFYVDSDLDLKLKPKSRGQIVRDALSEVGSKSFSLSAGNSEHFATSCRYGVATCRQVPIYRDSNQTDIEKGDNLKFDRDGKFFHYAVYIGQGKVVHQTKGDGVLLEDLKDVIDGDSFYVDKDLDLEYKPKDREQIVKDALSKVGRKGYHLFSSNCEHFATWCRYGVARCRQIKAKIGGGLVSISRSSSHLMKSSSTNVSSCAGCSSKPKKQ